MTLPATTEPLFQKRTGLFREPASDAYEERPSLPPAVTACLVAEALGREGKGGKALAKGWGWRSPASWRNALEHERRRPETPAGTGRQCLRHRLGGAGRGLAGSGNGRTALAFLAGRNAVALLRTGRRRMCGARPACRSAPLGRKGQASSAPSLPGGTACLFKALDREGRKVAGHLRMGRHRPKARDGEALPVAGAPSSTIEDGPKRVRAVPMPYRAYGVGLGHGHAIARLESRCHYNSNKPFLWTEKVLSLLEAAGPFLASKQGRSLKNEVSALVVWK